MFFILYLFFSLTCPIPVKHHFLFWNTCQPIRFQPLHNIIKNQQFAVGILGDCMGASFYWVKTPPSALGQWGHIQANSTFLLFRNGNQKTCRTPHSFSVEEKFQSGEEVLVGFWVSQVKHFPSSEFTLSLKHLPKFPKHLLKLVIMSQSQSIK